MLLWLWYRPAAAAPITPLSWELPYAVGAALKKKKAKKKKVTESSYWKILQLKNLEVCTMFRADYHCDTDAKKMHP